MGGLILAGIGRGLAGAADSVGNAMLQDMREKNADERALQKAMALEKFKDQMKEEAEQRDAAKAIEVDSRATKLGEQRTAKQLGTDAKSLAANAQRIEGDAPAMTEDEMKAHLQSLSPAERKAIEGTGLIGRSLTRNEQRLQSAEDQVQAARELGASSTLLKSYQEVKRSVLDEIKEENRDRRAAEAEEGRDRRAADAESARDRRQREMLPIYQQRADAQTTAAERPRGGGSGGADPNKPATTADLQRQITAAQNSLATELGVSKNDVNSEVASIKKKAAAGNSQAKATLERIQPFLDEYGDANKRMLEFKRNSSSGSSASRGNNSDNSASRPPLSSFVQR